MPRITKVVIGSPMGFKVNICSELTEVVLNSLIDSLKVYHGGSYVVGKDTMFNVTHHYHIHWFSIKDVSESAMKVKRNALGKEFPWLTRADKLYTGQELESADKNRWLAYCIKEQQIKSEGIEITEEIKVLAKASLETKRQKKVYSEKKEVETKEKNEFKKKLCEYVKNRLFNEDVKIPDKYSKTITDKDIVKLSVIKFMLENGKEGSLKKSIIDSYVMYCNIHIFEWDEYKVLGNLYLL